jgi:ArsR family transcriptional regulator, zinc-responsive transcriptional repressor
MAIGDGETKTSKGKTSVSKSKSAKDATQRLRKAQRAAILLKQASDPTRLQIILTLADGEKHVGALCDELNQTQPAVSHHLALLRHGSLITPRRQGKNNYYSLTESGQELAKVVRGIVV